MAFKLTKEQQKSIDDVLKAITETKKDIAKFKLAKIDVSAEEAELLKLEDQLISINRVLGTKSTAS